MITIFESVILIFVQCNGDMKMCCKV